MDDDGWLDDDLKHLVGCKGPNKQSSVSKNFRNKNIDKNWLLSLDALATRWKKEKLYTLAFSEVLLLKVATSLQWPMVVSQMLVVVRKQTN